VFVDLSLSVVFIALSRLYHRPIKNAITEGVKRKGGPPTASLQTDKEWDTDKESCKTTALWYNWSGKRF